MPWTAGGAPVTMERLFGFVKLGTTHRASRYTPSRWKRARAGVAPAAGGRFIPVVDVAAGGISESSASMPTVMYGRWTMSPHMRGQSKKKSSTIHTEKCKQA